MNLDWPPQRTSRPKADINVGADTRSTPANFGGRRGTQQIKAARRRSHPVGTGPGNAGSVTRTVRWP